MGVLALLANEILGWLNCSEIYLGE